MKTKTSRILAVVLIFQLLAFSACAGWLIYDAKVDRSGWAEKDGVRFYRDFHAKPVTGWLDIDGQRYFFLEGGIPATGWLEQDGVTRYFGSDGVMLTGWQTIGGKTYCFDDDGGMLTGWQQLDGVPCYLPDGVLATGWQEIDGKRYYFADDGKMRTGFTNVDGDIYCFDEAGQPLLRRYGAFKRRRVDQINDVAQKLVNAVREHVFETELRRNDVEQCRHAEQQHEHEAEGKNAFCHQRFSFLIVTIIFFFAATW